MKRFAFILILLFTGAITTFSQAVPTSTPDTEDVVKISTAIIQLDVTVTDKKGRPITDLKPEDFEVFENGEKQAVTNSSFISSVAPDEDAAAPVRNELGVPAPPTRVRPENIRRTIALVVDDLSLSFESAYQTRRALKKFVDEQMLPGDLVAVIRTGAGIGALQQFTSDKRQLHAAIEKVKWNPVGRGGISAFAPIEAPVPRAENAAGQSPAGAQGLSDEPSSRDEFAEYRNSIFGTGTLGALKYIVTGMAELPGRKSVILFSDGFKIFQRNPDVSGGGRVLDFLKMLIDAANRAAVVIYTIDPRGLQTAGITAADQVTNPEAFEQILTSRREELWDTQDGLRSLARQTGGFAVINNNDVIGGVRRVINDQSYYLIAYEPNSDTFDAKRRFNNLEIRVKRPNAVVRYRSGFFNWADRENAPVASNRTPVQQIHDALTSPFTVNGISLRLNPLFGNGRTEGTYVRSLLHVDAKGLTFTDEPGGKKKAVFDVLAVSFGDNGQPVETSARTYTMNVTGEGYKNLLENGFVYEFVFPVKKPGAYQYRVALRDKQGGKVGSATHFIEVPNLKKGNLTLSGIVLQGLTSEQWAIFSSGTAAPDEFSDPTNDTALRQFRSGSVLRYGYEIYNAKLAAARSPKITTKMRMFRDGQMVLDGKEQPLSMDGQTDPQRLMAAGALSLGASMQPGDYILQIIVTDNMAKGKNAVTTQYVQFEIVR